MSYIKEDVESMLKEFKKDEAKLNEIEFKLESLEERIKYAGYVEESSDNETIESMQLGSKVCEIPSGKTNKISNVTEQVAMTYIREMVHINKEDVTRLEKEVAKYEEEKDRYSKQIARVQNLLGILNDRQRLVITEYYINNKKKDWDGVAKTYAQEYPGKDLSVKQLQNIRDIALNDMLEVLNI
jgi:F0F1-type ATP synthase alpha subunit